MNGLLRQLRGLVWGALLAGACCAPIASLGAAPSAMELGRSIYVDGLGRDGRPIAAHQGEVPLAGKEAACIRCHRASGMGSVEGEVRVSPISGRYLYPREGDVTVAVMDGHVGKAINHRHVPYTNDSFARALGMGVAVDGRNLSRVMPLYALDDAERAGLAAYLGQLSVQYSVGAEDHLVHLATVITPDVSAARRQVFREMLETAVRRKNASTAPQRRYMASAAAFVTRSDRKWQLDVWELRGTPDTWGAQLDAWYQKTPPFAMLSGLGGQEWQPVHQFCDRHALPCWFPSVTLPGAEAHQGYNFYFSGGVQLEAEVLASLWSSETADVGRHWVQVHDGSPAALRAATTLAHALGRANRAIRDVVIRPGDAEALRHVLADLGPSDQVALWLPEGMLPADGGPPQAELFASATILGEGIHRVPATWRERLRLIYPYEMPERREANLAYLQAWLKINNIPLVDEVMQSEVFFSTNFLTDVLQDMLDNLYRDYLVERAEDMLGRRESGKAEQETRDRVTLGRTARTAVDSVAGLKVRPVDAPDAQTASRLIYGFQASQGTTVYPHLTLGPRQRYASKGAYIVGFASPASDALVPLQPWIVPQEQAVETSAAAGVVDKVIR
jgi:hypothetical protein